MQIGQPPVAYLPAAVVSQGTKVHSEPGGKGRS